MVYPIRSTEKPQHKKLKRWERNAPAKDDSIFINEVGAANSPNKPWVIKTQLVSLIPLLVSNQGHPVLKAVRLGVRCLRSSQLASDRKIIADSIICTNNKDKGYNTNITQRPIRLPSSSSSLSCSPCLSTSSHPVNAIS